MDEGAHDTSVPRHLATAEVAEARRAAVRVPLIRRVRLTVMRLMRTRSGWLVLVVNTALWLPLSIAMVRSGADQGHLELLIASVYVLAIGSMVLFMVAWRREGDPSEPIRYRDNIESVRGDSGIVMGVCWATAGLLGIVGLVVALLT